MSIITSETKSTDVQSVYETAVPILTSKKIWDDILNEVNENYATVNKFLLSKEIVTPENSDLKFLNDSIFPILLPILEKTLLKATHMDCVTNQKSLFNGIDYISERLWITNPKYPERQCGKQNIFLLDWVQEWLKDHPRLIFPKSWIWTKEEAALIIQAYIRGHFVRKDDEVQEMRQFWKTIKQEKNGRGSKGNCDNECI